MSSPVSGVESHTVVVGKKQREKRGFTYWRDFVHQEETMLHDCSWLHTQPQGFAIKTSAFSFWSFHWSHKSRGAIVLRIQFFKFSNANSKWLRYFIQLRSVDVWLRSKCKYNWIALLPPCWSTIFKGPEFFFRSFFLKIKLPFHLHTKQLKRQKNWITVILWQLSCFHRKLEQYSITLHSNVWSGNIECFLKIFSNLSWKEKMVQNLSRFSNYKLV